MAKYHMQKKEREIKDKAELLEILKQGRYVVIAMCKNNEPYIVTLSYGYDEYKKSLYFHTAEKGLKIDFINQNPSVCATVIDDKGYVMDECDHKFRSVVFWGEMSVVQDMDEKKYGMEILLNHLEDNPTELKEKYLKSDEHLKKAAILRLDIKELTGKSNITKK